MFQAGKLANVAQEMGRLKIDVLGLSEVRWTGCGEVNYQGKKLIYSGGERHERGVGFVLSKDASACLEGYYAKSDRILLIKLKGRPINVKSHPGLCSNFRC